MSHSIPGTATIIDSYPLHSISTTGISDGVNADILSGYVELSNVTTTTADVTGYHFYIERYAGTGGSSIGVWSNSLSPSSIFSKVGYSLVLEDAGFSGIEELSEFQDCKLIPNPAHSNTKLYTLNNHGQEYRIYDLSGKQVLLGNVASSSQTIDVSTLSRGVYYVRITSTNNSQSTCPLVIGY